MTIRFLGKENGLAVKHFETGFASLDRALGNSRGEIGWALPSIVEVSGQYGTGKTAFVFSIAGILASRLGGGISWTEYERQDKKTIEDILASSGFSGDVNCPYDDRDEVMLDLILKDIKSEKYSIGVIDSVAAFSSTAEQSGDIGDANMGKRALPMAQFSRRAEHLMMNGRNSYFGVLMTNHQYRDMTSKIAFMYTTPGGSVKNFISHNLIRLTKTNSPDLKFDTGWAIDGKITKNRDGYTGKTFKVFMIGGEGLHFGLSAMVDCLTYKLAKLKGEGKKKTVEIDGHVMGKLSEMIENRHNPELFAPFINALKSQQLTDDVVDEPTEE